MSLRFGKTRIKIHIFLPFIWLFTIITGAGSHLIPTLMALALHECGHLLAARWLRVQVEQIEITPHGGFILLQDMESARPLPSFLIAAAGPLASLMGCLAAAFLYQRGYIDFLFAQYFARGNILLLLVNLAPALPLDGGRMLRPILCRFLPWQRATHVLVCAGYIMGLLFASLSIYFAFQGMLILSPAFIGIYFIYSASQEEKSSTARYITSLIARRKQLEEHETVPVQWLAAGEHTSLLSLLGRMQPGKYHAVIVLSPDGMTRNGILYEQEICEQLLSGDHEKSLGDCLTAK